MSSITPIKLKRYNLWGDGTPLFTRFANNPPFTRKNPNTHTGFSLAQLMEIEFPVDAENQLLQIDGDFVKTGEIIPNIIQGLYDVDGAGPLEFNSIHTEIVYDERKMGNEDIWEYSIKNLRISRDYLGLSTCEYLSHIIITIALESPNTELMFNLGDIPCYFKAGSYLLNDNGVYTSEANTYTLTVPNNKDMEWQDSISLKFRASGKLLIKLQGVLVRRLLGACKTTSDPVIGACCTYSLDGENIILGNDEFEVAGSYLGVDDITISK